MMKFGLLGKGISHSFSADYFNKKFAELGLDARYYLFDSSSVSNILKLTADLELVGLNVTSPFKRDVIPFLDSLSEEAKVLNAVNVIECKRDEKGKNLLIGHNTDCEGFAMTLQNLPPINAALILGTGGAASAVAFALGKNKIPFKLVSRYPKDDIIGYEECNHLLKSHNLIVNATPVGMFPKTDAYPEIDYQCLTSSHICYDLIYNPPKTAFLKNAEERGAIAVNGLQMLINQADLAWRIWNHSEHKSL